MLCVIFICAYFCIAATGGDGISDKLSCEVTESFSYCWDNGIVYVDANNPKDTSFLSFHHYEMTNILNAFSCKAHEQSELDKIGYCCKQYYIRVKKGFKEDMRHYNIVILSDMKRDAPIAARLEELQKQDYVAVDIVSEAPVECFALMEYDCLIFVTYAMNDDLNDALSISKSFVKQCFAY